MDKPLINRIFFALLLAPMLHAQTWYPKAVVPEGGTATLPATVAMPITYRYGAAGKYCDPITVTTSTPPIVASNGSVPCTVNGVKTSDPAPNVAKELDVQEQTASFVVATVINGAKGSVTVPALPPVTPPPPTGPATTATVAPPDSTYRLSWCKTVLNTTTNQFTIVCNAATAGQ